MSLITTRIGVPFVGIGVPNPDVTLPSLATLVFDASSITPIKYRNTSIQNQLSPGTYQVILALDGYDNVNNDRGLTVTQSSPGSGLITITKGQAIKIHVAATAWPGGSPPQTKCVAIFLKSTNSANWTLAKHAYIDPNNDFNTTISVNPMQGAATGFSTALLQSASSDPQLGGRVADGNTDEILSLTQGGVQITRDVADVTVPPDQSPDYKVATARGAGLVFKGLANGMQDFVKAVAANFIEYTGDNGSDIQESDQTLLTAIAVLFGNRFISMQMPQDSAGVSETRTYIGNLTVNQTQITENWTKTATTPVEFNLQTAPQDYLLISQNSELIYRRA